MPMLVGRYPADVGPFRLARARSPTPSSRPGRHGRLESIRMEDQTSCVSEPHLFRVILPVTDIEAAASFYARVLGMPGSRVSGGRHYFDCSGTILACYDALADGDPDQVGPNPQYVYFSADDLDAAHERAREA